MNHSGPFESDNNSNTEDLANNGAMVIINCFLNVSLILTAILGNALVLTAILTTPSFRSPSMIMLCNLAVADFLVGLITQPFYIIKELTENRLLDILWDTLAYSFCGVSLLIITAISVDRFMALHYHLRYSSLVTISRVKFVIALVWCINFLSSAVYFSNHFIYHFAIAVITGICLIVSTFSYMGIYRIVRRHRLQIHTQQEAMQCSTSEDDLHYVRMKQSALNTFIFYIILVMCYLPMYILLTLHGLSQKPWPTEWNFATTLVFTNSSINPFLFCWRLRELRGAAVKTAKKIFCIQSESE
ncbi:melanocyte-stimulating hormone receptor-like [Orbicella faveolata]|nr:melanocyte-stimulating hormone receptor-like [Orbicella faveolata]